MYIELSLCLLQFALQVTYFFVVEKLLTFNPSGELGLHPWTRLTIDIGTLWPALCQRPLMVGGHGEAT